VRVTRIGVLSAAKMYAVLMGFFGLIFGAILALVSLLGAGVAATSDDGGSALAFGLGIGAVIALPIMYGLLGFISGLIGAWIYNVVAGLVGGLEIELSQ
jgi:hypothetical protein